MKEEEAMRIIHPFKAETQREADAKAKEINDQLEDQRLGPMVSVNFGEGIGWGCMFRDSAQFAGLFPQLHHIKAGMVGR